MAEMEQREETLRRDGVLIAIAGLSLLNGMHFSPFFDLAFIFLQPFAPGFFITSPLLLFYFTALLLSTVTLIIGGVPAAIFEHVTGRETSDFRSLSVWALSCAVLALPTILSFFGLF